MKETITILKDTNGNLYYYEGKDANHHNYHEVVEVDCDNGHYIYTYNSWWLSDEEFAQLTKIEVEVE